MFTQWKINNTATKLCKVLSAYITPGSLSTYTKPGMAFGHYIYSYHQTRLDLSCQRLRCLHAQNCGVSCKKMDKSLVLSALKNACSNQGYPQNVTIHSDRGSQYTSVDYIQAASRLNMRLSYSKKGCPLDNAPMEAFHALLKKEEVYICHYQTFEQAKISLFEYIEGFYNRNRIHSAINFLTPIAFEKACFAS